MRIPRIYQNRTLTFPDTFVLDESAGNHLVSVLRLGLHDKLILFNGNGQEYPATITHIKRNRVEVNIDQSLEKNLESPLDLHLGQALAKGDKMDLIVQKATELGVSEITPLFTKRSEVRLKGEREEKKTQHWQKVIQSACEQCGRNRLPRLHPPMNSSEWLIRCQDGLKIMLDPYAKKTFHEIPFDASQTVYLMIGSEGGFTREEIDMAQAKGFQGLRLGPRILRSETAALAAITTLQLLAGDFK